MSHAGQVCSDKTGLMTDGDQEVDHGELSWLLFSTIRTSSASMVPGWWQAGQQVEYLPTLTGLFVFQCCFPPWAQITKWPPLKRDWLRNSAQVLQTANKFSTGCRTNQHWQKKMFQLLTEQERLVRSLCWPTRSQSGVLRVKATFSTSTAGSLGWVSPVLPYYSLVIPILLFTYIVYCLVSIKCELTKGRKPGILKFSKLMT